MDQEDNITIRIATIEDAAKLLAIYAPYVENTAITFEYEVPSVEAFSERIAQILEKYPYLVAEKDGQMIGYAYASAFKQRAAYDWAVETSIYVARGNKRKGIGRRLYQALEEALKQQGILNVNACIAYTQEKDAYLTNDSVFFHERLGYKKVGHFHQCGYKFDRWYDMIWMEKFLGEHTENPPEVRFFSEIQDLFRKDQNG